MQRKEGRDWLKRVKTHPGHMSIPSIYLKKLRNSPADGGEARKSLSTSGYFSSCRKVEWILMTTVVLGLVERKNSC